MGVISPVGNTVDTFWESLLAGRHGISKIDAFDTEGLKATLAAQVRDFDPSQYIDDKKDIRHMDRYSQFAVSAAKMALDDSGDLSGYDPYRVGVIVGSGIGGILTFEEEHTKLMNKGPNRVSPFFIPMMISNIAAGWVSIKYGFKGTNYAVVTACATSSHAIGEAFHAIKDGYLDAAVTGGAEAAITPFSIAGFSNMTALHTGTDPDRASIPFDKERSGFVMGEGAGIVVLESLDKALARGAHIYAEVVGYGATGDAYHITAPDPDGAGGAKAMEIAMQEAGAKPSQIGYINAHGTSTQPNELCETRAIKTAFGDAAKNVAVSSTKSMTGHLLGAAGAVETIATAMTLKNGLLPPTVGYKVPDEECDLDYVTEGARKKDVTYALSNSLGFGGHNATLCLKKYEA